VDCSKTSVLSRDTSLSQQPSIGYGKDVVYQRLEDQHLFLAELKAQKVPNFGIFETAKHIWDIFEPTIDCPRKDRIGIRGNLHWMTKFN
jgi:hypothetical protein